MEETVVYQPHKIVVRIRLKNKTNKKKTETLNTFWLLVNVLYLWWHIVRVIHNYFYLQVIMSGRIRFGGHNLRGQSNRETEQCFQRGLSSEVWAGLREPGRVGGAGTHGPAPVGSCFYLRPWGIREERFLKFVITAAMGEVSPRGTLEEGLRQWQTRRQQGSRASSIHSSALPYPLFQMFHCCFSPTNQSS